MRRIVEQSAAFEDKWCTIGAVQMYYIYDGEFNAGAGPFSIVLLIVVDWSVNPTQRSEEEQSIKNIPDSNLLSKVEILFTRGEIRRSPILTPSAEIGGDQLLTPDAYDDRI